MVIRPLRWLNDLCWPVRVPLKVAIFLAVVLLVCYPNPGLFLKNLSRWRNPSGLIDTEAPGIQALAVELGPYARASQSPKEVLRAVERRVLERVEYAYDWDNWGAVDYFPTVEEILSRGKEDCDGRAIVAASVLRRLGIEAWVVADFAHAWVHTPQGDLMGPGRSSALVATPSGFRIPWKALKEFPEALAYGLAIFPAEREWIILLVAWGLMQRRGAGWRTGLVSLLLMAGGLSMLRQSSGVYQHPVAWLQSSGWICLGAGLLAPWVLSLLGRRKTLSPASEDANGSETL